MKYKIVTDSSSNMYAMEDIDHANVPLKIIFDNREYVDIPETDVGDMVNTLAQYNGKSGSSCPNAYDWIEGFGDADRVFAITITGKLSGSYGAAVNAAHIYEEKYPDRKVFVIDSMSAGPELRLIAEKIRQFIKEGHSFETIQEKIQAYQKSTNTMFALSSMKNLAENGRVSKTVAKIAGVLDIRVVGEAKDGELHPHHKCRGERKMLETIVEEMKLKGLFNGAKVGIAHCFNKESALALKEQILRNFSNCRVTIETTGILCSFYAEKGGLMIGFEGATSN